MRPPTLSHEAASSLLIQPVSVARQQASAVFAREPSGYGRVHLTEWSRSPSLSHVCEATDWRPHLIV